MTKLSLPARGDSNAGSRSTAGRYRAPQGRTRLTGSHGIDELVIIVVLATMPLTYVGGVGFGGRQLSGWAWLVSLAVASVALATRPLNHIALGYLAPYALFLAIGVVSLSYTPVFFEGLRTLAQTAAPAVVYLVAFRTALTSRVRSRSLLLLAAAYGAVIAALLVVGLPQGESTLVDYTGLVENAWVATRVVAINMIAVFLLVSALARSRRAVVGAGAISLAVAVGTGSRMAAAVLLLVISVSPRVFRSWRSRGAALIVIAAMVPIALSVPAVHDRFFFGESGGTVRDLLSGASNVNTAGRRELWPKLMAFCSDKAVTGYGIGASYEVSRRVSQGSEDQPHNDYIRTFCDTGGVGSIAVWWFVVAAGIRSLRRLRVKREDWIASSALLAVIAFLLLAFTDNAFVYPAHFTLPVFVLLAWADRQDSVKSPEGERGVSIDDASQGT